MKKVNMLFMLLLAVLSCSEESIEGNEKIIVKERTKQSNRVETTANEIIVKYFEGTPENEKISIRENYGIESYKQCACADDTLELWIFSSFIDSTTIEERKNTASNDPDLDGVSFNEEVIIQSNGSNVVLNGNLNEAQSLIVNGGSEVTIAVLDTGVNYMNGGFTTPFLYNNSDNEVCEGANYKDFFGWDFVNEDNNPFDDNNHGTIISRIIHDKLKAKGISHQLLPIKVFDQAGRTNMFLIICGFKYAINKSADIINMSFGSYTNNGLFKRFIFEAQEKILIVASSGNDGSDNDINPHFPSSYSSGEIENVLAIAGLNSFSYVDTTLDNYYNNGGLFLAPYSNYGVNSVDLAAIGGTYIFNINNQNIIAEGTSFACGHATSKCAAIYVNGMSPADLKAEVINTSYPMASGLGNIKYNSAILN